jgi:hypothetical protein
MFPRVHAHLVLAFDRRVRSSLLPPLVLTALGTRVGSSTIMWRKAEVGEPCAPVVPPERENEGPWFALC